MATPRPGLAALDLAGFTAGLMRLKEIEPRAALIAEQVSELLPGTGVLVYLVEGEGDNACWLPKGLAGEIALEELEAGIPLEMGTLGALASRREPVLFPGADLTREDYGHLNIRHTLVSVACIPLMIEENLLGAIEIVSYKAPISEESLAPVLELADYAALGLATAVDYEYERLNNLEAVTRLTALYDLEKVFNGIREMDELLPIVTAKIQEVLGVQAVNLWNEEEDETLILVQRTGEDPTVEVGSVLRKGEGIPQQVSDSGEPVLIADAGDERLVQRNNAARNAGATEGAIFSLMAVPLIEQGNEVGVLEVINSESGAPFDDDDVFFLTTIAESAAGALHNASLLQAERKVEFLETLVKVSQEITSTLNLERVLQAVVNGPQAVIPYERAAIALEQHGKLNLKAVSGMAVVNPSDPEVGRLNDLLHWVSHLDKQIYVTQKEGVIDVDREETRQIFKQYCNDSGVRAFYAVPLADEQGRVGILSLESSDPDFLMEAHFEVLKVLAGQATVALRNAEMYKEVPFIGVLEPLLEKKRRFLSLEKRRQKTILVLAAAVVLFLIVFPLPMRVDGTATVEPARLSQIQPAIAGTVRQVYVREGDQVQRGTILADLEDWEYRSALAAADARRTTALAEMNRALAANDGTEAGIQHAQVDYWSSEVARARERLEKTHLRAPYDGVVVTPHIENFAGRRLAAGDDFAQLADSSRATVNVAIDEHDVALLESGQRAFIKLESMPTATFRGEVTVVSPRSEAEGDHRVFFARVDVPNPEGTLRPGMQGRGKVLVGWRQAGYVFFRRPAMWLWSKLWSWLGW